MHANHLIIVSTSACLLTTCPSIKTEIGPIDYIIVTYYIRHSSICSILPLQELGEQKIQSDPTGLKQWYLYCQSILRQAQRNEHPLNPLGRGIMLMYIRLTIKSIVISHQLFGLHPSRILSNENKILPLPFKKKKRLLVQCKPVNLWLSKPKPCPCV